MIYLSILITVCASAYRFIKGGPGVKEFIMHMTTLLALQVFAVYIFNEKQLTIRTKNVQRNIPASAHEETARAGIQAHEESVRYLALQETIRYLAGIQAHEESARYLALQETIRYLAHEQEESIRAHQESIRACIQAHEGSVRYLVHEEAESIRAYIQQGTNALWRASLHTLEAKKNDEWKSPVARHKIRTLCAYSVTASKSNTRHLKQINRIKY